MAAIWREPKTDWDRYADLFEAYPDWERITDNLHYLYLLARAYYGKFDFEEMLDPVVYATNFPFADVLNAVEDNLTHLRETAGGYLLLPVSIEQVENQSFWNYSDLNRIESVSLRLHTEIPKLRDTQPNLAFRLGVGYIGSFIS